MSSIKKVKIIASSGPNYWYRTEIGQVFEVHQDLTRFDHWEVVEPDDGFLHNTRFIAKADAKEVEEAV